MFFLFRNLALVSLLFIVGPAFAQPSSQPRIVEGAARDQIRNDPVVNPSSSRPHPGIPAEALAESGRPREEEGEERESWAEARWSTLTLELPGNAKKTIAVARRSTLLIQANWPGQSDLTLTVMRGRATLKILKGAMKPGIGRVAAGQVTVPSAGDVVIGASGPGSPKVALYVGVVAAQ